MDITPEWVRDHPDKMLRAFHALFRQATESKQRSDAAMQVALKAIPVEENAQVLNQ